MRDASLATWRVGDPAGINASAIEHMDRRSLDILREDGADTRYNVMLPHDAELALLMQLELPPGVTASVAYDEIQAAMSPGAPDTSLVRFCRLLDEHGALGDTELAAPGDRRRAEQLIAIRESVPAGVNQRVGAAKRTRDDRIAKTAADMIVPFERFAEMSRVYREGFTRRGLDFAMWGHISDGNVHPNVIPRSYEDVLRGREAILAFGIEAARLGGCPLAEHGVGRNAVKQALLVQLYGATGVEEMRAVKRALDPEWKLAPGVIFEP
jgi:D-lactate dehydrogenase (cytochrome)